MSGFDETRRCDAVVVGGGPAGCAAATVLARHGVEVCLIDDGRRTSWPGETLPAGSTQVVTDVFGAGVLDSHNRAFAVQAAWETEELHVTDGLAHPLGEGWLLDRRLFDAQARRAAAHAGAAILEGHGTVGASESNAWAVRITGTSLHTSLLIDATGRTAVLARRLGALVEHGSDLLACIVITPESGNPLQATTVESVADGWWYSTPTPGGGRVLALVSDADLVPRGSARARWWLDSLRATEHIRALLPAGDLEEVLTQRMVLSRAGTGWLAAPYGERWAAVGDAAAHFDPLSSQGLLTGILMGARAGQAIVDDALADWSVDYRMLIDEHLELASHYYGLVDRWPASPFWRRRSRAS